MRREEGPLRRYHVAGRLVGASDALVSRLLGPTPPDGWRCDGCSASPDSWPPSWWPFDAARTSLVLACVWHDWSYHLGGSRASRRRADARFYWNLRALGCPALVAGLYYRRVRLWGLPHFRWEDGERPSGLAVRLALLVQRYSIPSPAEAVPPRPSKLEAEALPL